MAIANRMMRAARLDPHVYEEVEANPALAGEAMTAVIISAVAAGVGWYAYGGVRGFLLTALAALASWYLWANLTFWIGTRLLPGRQTHADLGQLLRVLGFASAPGVLRAAGIVQPLANTAQAVANIWMLVAMVVAVRQALDYDSTWRALAVVVIGWVVQVVALYGVFFLLGGGR